jgi:DNA-damage-inducible protein D
LTDITPPTESPFDEIRLQDEDGAEYWSGRDLAKLLEYSDLRNFWNAVERAIEACENSGNDPDDHFVDVTYMVPIGSGTEREVSDVFLSRYACYLIVQNADPGKPMVAMGQTYFTIQTRRQELADQEKEDQLRLTLRRELKAHHKHMFDAARGAGVIDPRDFAIFQNHGYQGLYGGLTKDDIHRRKGLKKSQEISDHMGSTELAANLFRATQTADKLKREGIKGKAAANQTHFEVGRKVRDTIRELGGTMPEDLPTPAESIRELEKREKARKRLDPGDK